MDEDQGHSQIVPERTPRRSFASRFAGFKKAFFTRDGLIGDYDYGFLFRPNLPFMKKPTQASPFFGLNDRMPVFLALLLGFQHALAMLAGVITPPIILSGPSGANLTPDMQQYLVSTALIVSGTLSMIQITRFHIYKVRCFVGPACQTKVAHQPRTDALLHRYRTDLRRRHLVCHHPGGVHGFQPDVCPGLLPDS
jgi:hypothetical protein